MNSTQMILLAAVFTSFSAFGMDSMTVIDRPESSSTNNFYSSNRQPLEPSQFIPLPIGTVQPKGWLLAVLERQRDGLCGHLGEISVWLQKDDNAWLSKDGKGKYGWEELPYWLRGYIQIACIFDDPKMIAESRVWINGALNHRGAAPSLSFRTTLTGADEPYNAREVWRTDEQTSIFLPLRTSQYRAYFFHLPVSEILLQAQHP